MNGRSAKNKKLASQEQFSFIEKYRPLLHLIPRVIILSFIIALIIRILSFIPLLIAYPDTADFEVFFDFSFYSNFVPDRNILGFIGSALWVTLKLVLLAWVVSIILGILFLFLKSQYYKLDFLWNVILSLGGIHVFGLIVIVQHIVDGYVPFILLVLVLAIGSGSLKEMVYSFEVVYKDVTRKEYWRFMYSQGLHPVRIGFAELVVRFTELSFTKLPILLVGSILVEAAANTKGLGFELLQAIKALEQNRVDLNILTGISFTMIFLVLLSQRLAEYVRLRFDPQSKVQS